MPIFIKIWEKFFFHQFFLVKGLWEDTRVERVNASTIFNMAPNFEYYIWENFIGLNIDMSEKELINVINTRENKYENVLSNGYNII